MATGTLYDNPNLFTESVSAVTATNTVQLGAVRWSGGSKYRYMYCDTGVAYPGYGVQLTSGGSGYSIATTITLGDPCFGVVQNTTMTTATYGWVLVDGMAKVQTGANSSISAGRYLVLTASGTFADWIVNEGTALSASAFYQIAGRSLGSGTGSGVSIFAAVHCFNA